MAEKYFITSENFHQIFKNVEYLDAAKTYSFDFSQWAQENNALSSATWTLKSGSCTIASTALASNVATALLTFSQAGRVLIQIKGNTGTQIAVVNLDILVKDPSVQNSDYGLSDG